jgi:hypothetical protein
VDEFPWMDKCSVRFLISRSNPVSIASHKQITVTPDPSGPCSVLPDDGIERPDCDEEDGVDSRIRERRRADSLLYRDDGPVVKQSAV